MGSSQRTSVAARPPWPAAQYGAYLVVAFLLTGFAALSRAFAYIRVGPLYITEVIIALAVMLHGLSLAIGAPIPLARSASARWALASCFGFLMYGTLRLIPALLGGESTPLALRNFGVVLYAAFVPIVYLSVWQDPVRRIRQVLGLILVASTLANALTVVIFLATEGSRSLDAYTKVVSGHTVLYAVISALVIIASTERTGNPAIPIPKGLRAPMLFLQLLFVYLSGHRSALLALVAGVLWLAVAGRRLRVVVRFAGVAVALGCLLALMGPLTDVARLLAEKYLTLFNHPTGEVNALWRLLFWTNVIHAWQEQPLLGIGFSPDLTLLQPWELGVLGERTDPHNSYVTVLARLGSVGAILLLGVIIPFLRGSLKARRDAPRAAPQGLPTLMAACLVSAGTYASMNVVLEGPYHGVFFWSIIGAGLALYRTYGPTHRVA